MLAATQRARLGAGILAWPVRARGRRGGGTAVGRDVAPLAGGGAMDAAEERRQLNRAAVASTVGTAIEWYDFFLYNTIAGLVFGKLFFPNAAPLVGTLSAFATQFGGFAARPIGAAIFGHYGDRIGRKATLIATLLLMGLATFIIGLIPGYGASSFFGAPYGGAGVWATVLLVILRIIQGIGVGGEWGGSVLLSMEWGHRGKRGLIASWPQMGVPIGLLISTVLTSIVSTATGANFLVWGWRIPFLLSIILVGVGLYIRLGILETPLFRRIVEERRVEPAPVAAVIRRNWREIILSALIRLPEQAPFYIFTSFIYAYGASVLKFDRGFLLNAVSAAAALELVSIPFFGYLSDRIGRQRMYLIGGVATLVWAIPYFLLLDTKLPVVVVIAIVVSLIPHDMLYGPQAAFIAESFTGRLRYSGASLGYQLASVIAGGPAPLIATALLAAYHSSGPIAAYIIIISIIGIIATLMLRDRSRMDISREYEEQEGTLAAPAPARARYS